MQLLAVSRSAELMPKGLAAKVADVRLLAGVGHFVHLQPVRELARVVAVAAREGLLLRVRLLMAHQVVAVDEALLTKAALKGLHAGVDLLVRAQAVRCAERTRTLIAGELVLVSVRELVTPKRRGQRKHLVALVARKRRLVGVVFLVSLQVSLQFKTIAAYTAGERFVAVVVVVTGAAEVLL